MRLVKKRLLKPWILTQHGLDEKSLFFTSDRLGRRKVFRKDLGEFIVANIQVTRGLAVDSMPHLSPDGKKIIFASNKTGNWDIWTFHFETGEQVQLTTDPADDFDPKWSPDGE